jgi:hypothetical protein
VHVQEACLSTARDVYTTRIDKVVAQIPVKTANNTPAGELLGQTANAPRGLKPEAFTSTEASAIAPPETLQPLPASMVPPDTIVRGNDLQSSDAFFSVSRSMLWSAEMFVMFVGVFLL